MTLIISSVTEQVCSLGYIKGVSHWLLWESFNFKLMSTQSQDLACSWLPEDERNPLTVSGYAAITYVSKYGDVERCVGRWENGILFITIEGRMKMRNIIQTWVNSRNLFLACHSHKHKQYTCMFHLFSLFSFNSKCMLTHKEILQSHTNAQHGI